MAHEQTWSIGERVRDEGGHVATVRYIGNVASAKDQSALYIGVEWDDPTRGKHDGSAIRSEDGVKIQHFTCTEGAGSFLKPKKIIRGETFGNVMRRRYVTMNEEMVSKDNKLDMEQAHVKTWNGRALPIELYGELKIRKQQQLGDLDRVTCRDENVSFAGPDCAETLPLCTLLDLQGNLLSDWGELASIGTQLNKLEQLRINGNRMHMPSLNMESFTAQSFPNLKILVLNTCGITSWSQVCILEKALPVIEQLSIAYTDVSDIESVLMAQCGGDARLVNQNLEAELALHESGDKSKLSEMILNDSTAYPPVTGFSQLKHLDLSHCGLTSWRQVLRFCRVPNLEQLHLTDNAIPDIWPMPPISNLPPPPPSGGLQAEEASSQMHPFEKLFYFSLSGTNIDSWADIDALNTYGVHSGEKKENGPSDLEKRDGVGWEEKEALEREAKLMDSSHCKQGVRVMRFSGNTPLISGMGASEVRQMCIARMPFLSMLNGSNVRVKERLEAEKSYVRRVMREIARDEKTAGPASPDTASPEIIQNHPRFVELFNTFGTQLTPMGAGGTGSLGTQEVVSVTLQSMAAGSIEKEPVTKKLPGNFQVRYLLLFLLPLCCVQYVY
mmetsp:Transcript_15568/g.20201  ORF Transcript_15568/g.20201 Transcript_15568/m.20201 type:complete len:612 (-) Transcript_15568:585-2420(-)